MNRTRVLRLVRVAYLAALGVAAVLAFFNRRDQVRALVDGTRAGWLVLSLALSFGMLVISSLFWTTAIRSLSGSVDFAVVLRSTCRSVAARYLPGSVWYAVGRAALLRREGVSPSSLGAVAVLEVVMSLATALAVGAGILGSTGSLPGGMSWVLPAVIALAVVVSPPVVSRVVGRFTGADGDSLALRWSGYGRLLVIMLIFWLWSAGAFAVYLRAFPANDAFDTVIVVGGFLLSWGVGFLAFIAPQGAGVFELTLASILVSQGVPEVALVIGGYRVVTMIRDVIATAYVEVAGRGRAAPVRQ